MGNVTVIQGDITKCKYDANVNSAHESLRPGSGVFGAIHKAAGKKLEEECLCKYNGCETGKSVITRAYNLPSKYVFHTVTPRYIVNRGDTPRLSIEEKEKLLFSCYYNSLDLTNSNRLKSIVFSCFGIGKRGFPA